jgi:hypothetical protein
MTMDISKEVREYVQLLINAAAVFIWPAILTYALWLFKEPLKTLLSRGKSLGVRVLGTEVTITTDDVYDILVDAVSRTAEDLSPNAKSQLRKAMFSDGWLVKDAFPSFDHNSEEHKALAELRRVGLIRPREGGGVWTGDRHIQVTPLGALVKRVWREQEAAAVTNT